MDEEKCQSKWSMDEAAEILNDGNSPFCNVTWDSILCWPLIPLNRTIRLPCPAFSGGQTGGYAERHCRQRNPGQGVGRVDMVSWSDYSQCFNDEPVISDQTMSHENVHYQLISPNEHDHIWSHATSADAEAGLLDSVAAIQRGARQLETIGLLVTIFTICSTMFLLHRLGRLHSPENAVRSYVFISMLMYAIAKTIVLLDITTTAVPFATRTRGWCEVWYFLLEFSKASLNFWFFFRCFALFCAVVVKLKRQRALKDCPYLFAGWLAPIVTSITWVCGLIVGGDRTIKGITCPELYYHTGEYWSVLIPQLTTLVCAAIFLIAGLALVFRQFYKRRSEVHVGDRPFITSDQEPMEADAMLSVSTMSSNAIILADLVRFKWQLVVELVVLFLLSLPFVLELFFYAPNVYNLHVIASLTYVASFFSMFQGLFISLLYSFAQLIIPNHGHNSVVLQKYQNKKFEI